MWGGGGSTEQLGCSLRHHICHQSQDTLSTDEYFLSGHSGTQQTKTTTVSDTPRYQVTLADRSLDVNTQDRSFYAAGPAQPQPLALSEPLSPDESQPDAASRLLSPVLIHPRWLPEECPFLHNTVAVPAAWDCVCTNALPEMIITMNYEHGHGSNSNFSFLMFVWPCILNMKWFVRPTWCNNHDLLINQ